MPSSEFNAIKRPSHKWFWLVFFLVFGLWLVPTSVSYAQGFMVMDVTTNTARINAGGSATLDRNTTVFNSANQPDPADCNVSSNISNVGPNDIWGSKT